MNLAVVNVAFSVFLIFSRLSIQIANFSSLSNFIILLFHVQEIGSAKVVFLISAGLFSGYKIQICGQE